MNKVSGFMPIFYGVIGAGFVLTFCAGVFVLTLEPDESWILFSTMKAFGIPLPPTSAVDNPVLTSGGLHLVLHGLIAQVAGTNISVHRLASIIVTLVLLGIVFQIIEHQVKDRVLAAAGTALFATAPGFLLQSSLATAEIMATTIFLVAVLYWVHLGGRSVAMAIIGGVIFGLACATRMTCLSMLPAILVWSIFAHRVWSARLFYPVLGVAIALFVYVAFVLVYFNLFNDSVWSMGVMKNALASGITRPYEGLIMRLNYLATGDSIIPVIAIVALGAWLISQLGNRDVCPETLNLCSFLFLAGSAGWLAWVIKSPIPHIRYLWPAIPMLWLAAILLGLSALSKIKQQKTVMIVHLALIIMCASQGLLNLRMLAVGDSLALVYEAARRSELGTPKQFLLARIHQNEMAKILEGLPLSANIYAYVEPAAYPMTYISGRTVKSLRHAFKESTEDYLLVLPSDNSIWLPKWDLIGWIQNNTTLAERRGEYKLYKIREGALLPNM